MKLKLAGAALGALMVGLVGAGEAKADAVAVADMSLAGVFTAVDGSGNPLGDAQTLAALGGIVAGIDPNNAIDTLGSQANLNGVNLTGSPAQRNLLSADPASSTATLSNGSSVVNSTASLVGSLLTPGGTTSLTNSNASVLNGNSSVGNNPSTTQTNDSFRFVFQGSTAINLELTLSGSKTLYTSITNTNNFAQSNATASIAVSFTLTDETTGVVQNFTPGALNSSISSNSFSSTPYTSGSLTASTFANISNIFLLNPGDGYDFVISQTSKVDATAVPEPGTLFIFGAGLAGLGFLGFRRQKKTGGLAA